MPMSYQRIVWFLGRLFRWKCVWEKGCRGQQKNGKDTNCILIIPYLAAMQACFGINLYDKMHVFYFGIRGQWSLLRAVMDLTP
jgi:hypothetical protein